MQATYLILLPAYMLKPGEHNRLDADGSQGGRQRSVAQVLDHHRRRRPRGGAPAAGAARKSRTACGVVTISVSLQSRCFSSFVLLVLVMVVAVVSITSSRSSGSDGEPPSTMPPAAAFLVKTTRSSSAAAEFPTVPPPSTAAPADGAGEAAGEASGVRGRLSEPEPVGIPGLHKTLNSTTGPLFSFNIHEYNASVDFYWSPLLVESNSDHPLHHRVADRTVRAASIVKHARHWTGADVLVFNSYLWWLHPSIKVRWGAFDEAYGVSKAVDGLRAFELALTTLADWLEFHVDRARTRLFFFFMSMSPTHLRSDGASKQGYYNETEPFAAGDKGSGGDHGRSPAFAHAVEEHVQRLGARGVAVRVVNVTGMSERHRDAHPPVHRRQWDPLTEGQRRDPGSYADCIYAHIVS